MSIRTLSDLQYRLRAEELRAIAGQMTVEENHAFLVGVAEDYERLAKSAALIKETKERLAQLNQRWPQSAAFEPRLEQSSPATRESERLMREKAKAYRDMAGDAERLAEDADAPSRQGWLSLAELWAGLADGLECQARPEIPAARAPAQTLRPRVSYNEPE